MRWVWRLNEMGVAALLVHSFGARHIPEGMRILSGGLIVYVLDCTTAVNTYNSA